MNKNKFNQPVLFYSLSLLLPWIFWFTAAYLSHSQQSLKNIGIVSIIGFIGLLVPMLLAFWLMISDNELKKDLWRRFFNFRQIRPIYLCITCFLMPASILLAQSISLLFGYSVSQFIITGKFTFSSGVFPVWFMLIIAPVVEELAWHTYGTDALRTKMNVFYTSLTFSFFWGIWHLPLSFIKDYYQSNIIEGGWIYGVNFLVSLFPFVFIMNWLYYKTHRNILVAILFHITAGYFNEIFATHPDSKIIQTGLLLVFALAIIIKDKKLFFEDEMFFKLEGESYRKALGLDGSQCCDQSGKHRPMKEWI